jgi:predicted nucleic acid-binding protein
VGTKGAEAVAAASGAVGLTDTDILIDAARGVSDAISFLAAQRTAYGLLIPDALIAATALEHGQTLHTKNARHFRMIPNLKIIRPY